MDANGSIVTLWAWQGSNSIVSHGSIKSDEVRLIETLWNDMKWHEMIWNDKNRYEMNRNDTKWYEMT